MLVRILTWIISIFVGIFSILVALGFMANRRELNAGPHLDGPGPQDKEEQVRMLICSYGYVPLRDQSLMSS